MFGLPTNQTANGKATIVIEQPVEKVFSFITTDFFDNYPRWSPEVQLLEPITDPPLRLNSLVRQVRVDQGQRSDSTFRVSSFDHNKQLVFEGVKDGYRCSYDFASNNLDKQTELTFTFELTRLELFMLPFEKLIRIAVQEGAKRTVKNLKNLIES
jgi:uncharacterized protein YndB with AHSA1/START domain